MQCILTICLVNLIICIVWGFVGKYKYFFGTIYNQYFECVFVFVFVCIHCYIYWFVGPEIIQFAQFEHHVNV